MFAKKNKNKINYRICFVNAMAEVKVTLEVGYDGVAIIAISNPPVNALAIPSKLYRMQGLLDRLIDLCFL